MDMVHHGQRLHQDSSGAPLNSSAAGRCALRPVTPRGNFAVGACMQHRRLRPSSRSEQCDHRSRKGPASLSRHHHARPAVPKHVDRLRARGVQASLQRAVILKEGHACCAS